MDRRRDRKERVQASAYKERLGFETTAWRGLTNREYSISIRSTRPVPDDHIIRFPQTCFSHSTHATTTCSRLPTGASLFRSLRRPVPVQDTYSNHPLHPVPIAEIITIETRTPRYDALARLLLHVSVFSTLDLTSPRSRSKLLNFSPRFLFHPPDLLMSAANDQTK